MGAANVSARETADGIAAFAMDLAWSDLDDSTVHHAKRALLDAVGCLIGAIDSPLADLARRIAARNRAVEGGATVFGLDRKVVMEAAVFANTAMVRYLDFNDTYYAPSGGALHLSDVIPAVLAAAEMVDADGMETLLGLIVGYEVGAALAKGSAIRSRGWDQGTYIAIAAAAATGRMLGGSRTALRDAIAIAASSNIATRQTRSGHLGMWKGAATAAAAMNGAFASVLAAEGMTGPTGPFDGEFGLKPQVTGPFELELPPADGQYAVIDNNIKAFPSEYHSQAPVWLALELRRTIPPARIERVAVRTYRHAYTEIGMDPEKWRPTNRETADHSLPFILAVAMIDGRIDQASFTPERWTDSAVLALMDRTSVEEDPAATARYPAEFVTEITVVDVDGGTTRVTTTNPHGHRTDPLTDAELEAKVDRLCLGAGQPALAGEVQEVVWGFDRRRAIDLVQSIAGASQVTGAGQTGSISVERSAK